jgi:hypothetical protein
VVIKLVYQVYIVVAVWLLAATLFWQWWGQPNFTDSVIREPPGIKTQKKLSE